MKKFLLLTITLICCALCFTSCADDGIEVPEGMQIVKQSEKDGYIFFGPEGWIVANQGEIGATYLSRFNKTSITFVKTAMPTEEGETLKERLDAYFDKSIASFHYADSVSVSKDGEKVNFGASGAAADEAYKYIYTYKADGTDIACMQILLTKGDDFFIFTYTSFGSITDESSDYRVYLEKAQSAVTSFTFTKKSDTADDTSDYQKDGDGYILISDGTLSGFELYVPDGSTVLDNSGIVRAEIAEGAIVTASKPADTNVNYLDYVQNLRAKVEKIADFGSITDIAVKCAMPIDFELDYFKSGKWKLGNEILSHDPNLKLGNIGSASIVSYEYTYKVNGESYHVYFIFGVQNAFLAQNGYTLSYVCRESVYEAHLDELNKIINKIVFK